MEFGPWIDANTVKRFFSDADNNNVVNELNNSVAYVWFLSHIVSFIGDIYATVLISAYWGKTKDYKASLALLSIVKLHFYSASA